MRWLGVLQINEGGRDGMYVGAEAGKLFKVNGDDND